jgi:hypothetical protein
MFSACGRAPAVNPGKPYLYPEEDFRRQETDRSLLPRSLQRSCVAYAETPAQYAALVAQISDLETAVSLLKRELVAVQSTNEAQSATMMAQWDLGHHHRQR